jgi:hypothetical protein
MTIDRRFQTIFKEKSLSELWCGVSKNSSSFGRSAVTALLPFGSTYEYLCEKSSFCHNINDDQAAETDLILTESNIPSRVDKMLSLRQAQVFH